MFHAYSELLSDGTQTQAIGPVPLNRGEVHIHGTAVQLPPGTLGPCETLRPG